MYELDRVFSWWPMKLLATTLITIFSPFQIPIYILITMLFLDTFTGIAYAIRMKKFSSSGIKSGIGKVITYFLAILVVRLLEIGISSIVNTVVITHAITTYLIITEGLSVLENLTLLGVPIPPAIRNMILKQFDNTVIDSLFKPNDIKFQLPLDINELSHNISNINEEQTRDLYTIILKEFTDFIIILNSDTFFTSDNKDLFYYKVMASLNISNDKIYQECKRKNISSTIICKVVNPKSEDMMTWKNEIKNLCYSDESLEEKKQKLTEDVLLFLYKLIAEST